MFSRKISVAFVAILLFFSSYVEADKADLRPTSLPHSFGILALGDRDDAVIWRDKMASRYGVRNNILTRNEARETRQPVGKPAGEILSLRAAEPNMEVLTTFASSSPQWLFLGGHFKNGFFFNGDDTGEAIGFRWFDDHAIAVHREQELILVKGEEFRLHENLEVIFWGSCDIHDTNYNIEQVRELFSSEKGYPLMIGWKGHTGWQVTHSIMGGFGNEEPHASRDFFDRLEKGNEDPLQIAEAWLTTVRDTEWGRNSKVPGSASVILPNGVELVLKDKQIVESGRKF